MKTKNISVFIVLALLTALIIQPPSCYTQGTAFTYQGRLNNGTTPATGNYDLVFSLFSGISGGSIIAGPLTNSPVGVTNGLLTVTLDFGANFPGSDRWLEIAVRTNGGSAFTTLVPRQPVTPTPYALVANNVSGPLVAAQLTSIGNSNGGNGNFFVGPSGNLTTSGYDNTAIGQSALNHETSGGENTALGYFSLSANTNGNNNTAIGSRALQSLKSGTGNIAIGERAGEQLSAGSNNIEIGNGGAFDESDTIRIGTSQTKALIHGISGGNIVSSSDLVCVNSGGLLGTVPSGGAMLAGDLNIAGGANAYHHVSLNGGNSTGFLYGSYPYFGDGVHLGYNFYSDTIGDPHVINAGGGTSRVTASYSEVVLAVGNVNSGPNIVRLDATLSGVTVYGTFNNLSDRNAKQDFAPVSPAQILEAVTRLPVSEWSYKEDVKTRHIGPVAQDFHAVFNIGTDEKHIAPIDEGGIAFAAIQGLNQKVETDNKELRAENAELKQQNDLLAVRLNQLETMVKKLATSK